MTIFDIVGWAGTLCILASYFLLVAGHRLGQGVSYMLINLVGSILMVVNVVYNRAWPAVALQSAFILISVWGILRSLAGRASAASAD